MSIHNHGQYSMIASTTKGPIGPLVFHHCSDIFKKGCKCQGLRYKIFECTRSCSILEYLGLILSEGLGYSLCGAGWLIATRVALTTL